MKKIMLGILVLIIVIFAIFTVPAAAVSPPAIICQKTFDDPEVRDVAVDSNDNIIVTGDEYIAKFDSACNELWVREFYDSSANFRGVAVDNNDNIIVAGDLGYDILIAKYTPSGTKLWDRTYDFDGWNDDANAVAVDSNGNIIVVGETRQREPPWEEHWIVLKCNSNGNELWRDVYSYTYDNDGAEDVAVDSYDNIIVTGSSEVCGGFYPDDQMLTIKYEPDGDRMWLRKYGTVDTSVGVGNYAETVTVDSQDDIIIGGYSEDSDKEVIKYNSGGGILWEKDSDSIESSAVTSSDEIIIASNHKIYLLTSDGDEVWWLDYIDGYSAEGVAVDSADNIIVAGDGSSEGIIVKYGAEPCGNMGASSMSWSPTIDAGTSDSQTVTVSASGGTVKGVTVSKIDGPSWLSVSPTNLGDIASGSSKTFTITASPPCSDVSGDFPYDFKVSCTCGTPSEKHVTGTIHVPCGTMDVNPIFWSDTVCVGSSISKVITVSAIGGVVKGVTVSKESGPAWLSVSPTNLGDIPCEDSKTFTMTASPPSGTSGDFAYTVRVSNTCGTPSSKDVTGTIHVKPKLMEGDVDELNNCVALKDSTLIKLYLVGKKTLTPDQLECADTYDDGDVTLKDSTAIKKWLVDPDFPLWQSPADDHMMKPVSCYE